MSNDARDIRDLMTYARSASVERLLREYAARIIGSGLRDQRGGL
jgi:hypothetical protein